MPAKEKRPTALSGRLALFFVPIAAETLSVLKEAG